MHHTWPRQGSRMLLKARLVSGVVCAGLFAGCTPLSHLPNDPTSRIAGVKEMMLHPTGGWTRASAGLVKTAMKMALEGKLQQSSKQFNQAVKYDPTNSYAHFLNGYVYHLMGLLGTPDHYGTAEIGYKLAIQLDPGNLLAVEQLGRLYLAMHQYRKAQDTFAIGLFADVSNPEFILGLVVASYLAQDLETAVAALRAGERVIPDRPEFLRLAALVYAAAGEGAMAASYAKRYKGPDGAYLQSRIARWQEFYRTDPLLKRAQDNAIVKAGNVHYLGPLSDYMNSCAEGGAVFVGAPEVSDDALKTKEDDKKDKDKGKDATPATPEAKPDMSNAMVVVDVVMILAEEVLKGQRGINLVDTLSLVATGKYGVSKGLDASSLDSTSSSTSTSDSSSTPSVTTRNEAWQYALALPTNGITYALNLANDTYAEYNVLAKPSLAALNGQTSKFFSGRNLTVLTSSNFGSGQVEKIDVGITLNVTPTFVDSERIKLNVTAERDFFTDPNDLPQSVLSSSNFYFETAKNSVTADVEMAFDETLVLSGVFANEKYYDSDSTPGWRAIPGIRNFFNQRLERDVRRSVIFLITPHAPRGVHSSGENFYGAHDKPKKVKQPNLTLLKTQFNDLFNVTSGASQVFAAVSNPMYEREFNPRDVQLRQWESPQPAPYVFMNSYTSATE